jgi:hypothetical protein
MSDPTPVEAAAAAMRISMFSELATLHVLLDELIFAGAIRPDRATRVHQRLAAAAAEGAAAAAQTVAAPMAFVLSEHADLLAQQAATFNNCTDPRQGPRPPAGLAGFVRIGVG